MGFLDKAKQRAQELAEQAQTKLDEVQQQFNDSQKTSGEAAGGSAVEYDQHGRPADRPAATPQQGDPATPGQPVPPPAATETTPDPGAGESATGPHGDPLAPAPEAARPPKPPSSGSGMSSGDPLAG